MVILYFLHQREQYTQTIIHNIFKMLLKLFTGKQSFLLLVFVVHQNQFSPMFLLQVGCFGNAYFYLQSQHIKRQLWIFWFSLCLIASDRRVTFYTVLCSCWFSFHRCTSRGAFYSIINRKVLRASNTVQEKHTQQPPTKILQFGDETIALSYRLVKEGCLGDVHRGWK